jgi:uncharacterized phage protein (TIGR01671 family)
MREIKFRAWHKEFKTMYWFDVINGMKHGIGSGYIPMAPWGFPITISQYKDNLVPVDPMECELMQYTGLKDKNGKEIYEGDILEHNQKKFIVKNSTNKFVVVLKEVGSQTNWRDLEWCNNVSRYIVVIGNIYENPELVKF